MYEIEKYVLKNKLAQDIIQKAKDLNISYTTENKIIGFGKYDNFYMFYITIIHDELNIKIRKEYHVNSEKISLNLIRENESYIMSLISNIYNHYKFGKGSIIENPDSTQKKVKSWAYELEEAINSAVDKRKNDAHIPYNKISNRLSELLRKHNIETFYDLFSRPAKKIRAWRNCGPKSIKEMILMINDYANELDIDSDISEEEKNICKFEKSKTAFKDEKNYLKAEALERNKPLYITNLQAAIEDAREGSNLDNKINLDRLSTRSQNILKRNKIVTIKDLVKYNAVELALLNNCGVSTLNEFKTLLANSLVENQSRDPKSFLLNTRLAQYFTYDEEVDQMIYDAKQIAQYFDFFIETSVTNSHLELYKEHVFSEKITLETLGKKSNITRERVRQIVKSENEKLLVKFHLISNISIKNKIDELISRYENEKFLSFIFYGFCMDHSRKYIIVLLNVIYGSETIGNTILEKIDEFASFKGRNKSMTLEEISKFPGNTTCKIDFESLYSTKKDFSYKIFDDARELIDKLSDVDEIINNPDISFEGLTPTFAIKLHNSKIIFAYICNKVKFAVYYNKERFEALDSFCKNNGCGYVIMDDKLNTKFQLENVILAEEIQTTLDNHFTKNKTLNWGEVKSFREKLNCNSDFIITYILQNNLFFSFQPYIIMKKD